MNTELTLVEQITVHDMRLEEPTRIRTPSAVRVVRSGKGACLLIVLRANEVVCRRQRSRTTDDPIILVGLSQHPAAALCAMARTQPSANTAGCPGAPAGWP